MRRPRLEISAGGVLLLAALIFVLTADELTALALAVLAHEAGHAAAIYLTGGRVTALRLAVTGPIICRTGGTDGAREAFCALAGPLAGVLYAIVSAERLPLSAGMSLVLSAFNSLPALPLDGGRALAALAGGARGGDGLVLRLGGAAHSRDGPRRGGLRLRRAHRRRGALPDAMEMSACNRALERV